MILVPGGHQGLCLTWPFWRPTEVLGKQLYVECKASPWKQEHGSLNAKQLKPGPSVDSGRGFLGELAGAACWGLLSFLGAAAVASEQETEPLGIIRGGGANEEDSLAEMGLDPFN